MKIDVSRGVHHILDNVGMLVFMSCDRTVTSCDMLDSEDFPLNRDDLNRDDLNRDDFNEQLADAYEHLYDLVYLRTHPLTDIVVAGRLRRKEKAWQLHHILIDVVDELNPGEQAPVFSREWRRHALMVYRYVDGLDPQSVADQLGISRRHYYREHRPAIEAVADILWDRYVRRKQHQTDSAASLRQEPPLTSNEVDAAPDREALLRMEAARIHRGRYRTQIAPILPKVASLFEAVLEQRSLAWRTSLPADLAQVAVDPGVLRQMIMGSLGYFVEHASEADVHLTATNEKTHVRIALRIDPVTALQTVPAREVSERLTALQEMGALSGVSIRPISVDDSLVGFEIVLPVSRTEHVVLVVDDHADVADLFERYLIMRNYRIAAAQTAQQGLELVRRLHPDVIFLDLMLPGQDGWDLLQTLRNQPDTQHIPVIVCSVLRQRDLALMLGASGFLQKPFTEPELLDALRAVGIP